MKKTLKRIVIGIGIIFSVVIIGYLGLLSMVWYQFNVGCGMDDGPFKAVRIENFQQSEKAEKFKLKNGELFLDNRHDTLSPVLTYVENNKIKWILDTDVRNTKGYEYCRISSINELKVTENSSELNLNFYAIWTYGAESGSMKIDKEDGDNKFCLSW